MSIRKGDIVLHKLSNLYFICENAKMERWMNLNSFYTLVNKKVVPEGYFIKTIINEWSKVIKRQTGRKK